MATDTWKATTLMSVVSLQRGHDLPETERIAGLIPVMGSFGVTGWHNAAKCSGPGVTVGRSGASFGVVSYVDQDYWPLNTVLFATDFHGNDERFVYYLLKTIDFSGYNTGSAQPSLNRNHLVNIPVSLPDDIRQQRGIVEILGSLDDKIEQNRRTGRALERLARATFKAWFLDFEPVKAKAAGADGFPGMPPAAFAAVPARLTGSLLGPLPEGWEIGTVESLCTSINSGGTPSRSNGRYWESGQIDWFKTGELFDGPLLESEEKITHEGLENSSCKLWEAGTVLFALYASPTVGRLGILTGAGTSNQAAAGLVARPEIGVPFLVQSLLLARDELQRIAVGAAQQNINQRLLRTHRMLLPIGGLALAYSQAVQPMFLLQSSLLRESSKLAALRDYLLPRLLSGRVRVRSPKPEGKH